MTPATEARQEHEFFSIPPLEDSRIQHSIVKRPGRLLAGPFSGQRHSKRALRPPHGGIGSIIGCITQEFRQRYAPTLSLAQCGEQARLHSGIGRMHFHHGKNGFCSKRYEQPVSLYGSGTQTSIGHVRTSSGMCEYHVHLPAEGMPVVQCEDNCTIGTIGGNRPISAIKGRTDLHRLLSRANQTKTGACTRGKRLQKPWFLSRWQKDEGIFCAKRLGAIEKTGNDPVRQPHGQTGMHGKSTEKYHYAPENEFTQSHEQSSRMIRGNFSVFMRSRRRGLTP